MPKKVKGPFHAARKAVVKSKRTEELPGVALALENAKRELKKKKLKGVKKK